MGACGKVSANFDLYSVLLTFPWALLLSFLFFLQGRVRNGTGTRVDYRVDGGVLFGDLPVPREVHIV